LWGALHGGYLIAGILTRPIRDRIWEWIPNKLQNVLAPDASDAQLASFDLASPLLRHFNISRIREIVAMIFTFHLVLISWVFFRAGTLSEALYILGNFLPGTSSPFLSSFGAGEFLIALLSILVMEIVHLVERSQSLETWLTNCHPIIRWGTCYAILFSIMLFGVFNNQEFIYFQF